MTKQFEYAIEVLEDKIKELSHLIAIWQWEDGEDDYCDLQEEDIAQLQSAITHLKELANSEVVAKFEGTPKLNDDYGMDWIWIPERIAKKLGKMLRVKILFIKQKSN